jgi:hypothetical protein
VIARHRHDSPQRRARRYAERVALALHDEGRHPDRIELGEPARRGRSTGAPRRNEREREAEYARCARRFSGAARHAGACRPAARHEWQVAEQVRAQPLHDREPRRVEVVCRGRAATAGNAIRLLDERNAHVLGERSFGNGDEIAGRHAAARAVTEHEPAARRLGMPRVHLGRAVRSVDVEHHRGVCPQRAGRPMSFDRTPCPSSEIETKGSHR